MVGAEAGIDEAVLLRLGIEHRYLPARTLEREGLGRRMIRSLPAISRIFDAAHRRRQPHTALLVEHAVVIVGPLAPDLLFAPIGGGADRIEHGRAMERRAERLRRIGIGDRHLGEAVELAQRLFLHRLGHPGGLDLRAQLLNLLGLLVRAGGGSKRGNARQHACECCDQDELARVRNHGVFPILEPKDRSRAR